jgi:Rne/Rng family ribonuclease
MQAAFVDIGLDRAAFIHASEISLREGPAVESISALVHEGQSLVVQVTKDPIGSKGARLTTQLSIPSRYLVYMPRTAHVGISLKIEDEAERERLKQVVSDCVARKASRRPAVSSCAPPPKAPVPMRSSWTSATCAACGTRSARRSRPSAPPV